MSLSILPSIHGVPAGSQPLQQPVPVRLLAIAMPRWNDLAAKAPMESWNLRIRYTSKIIMVYSQTHPSIAKNKMNTELYHTLPMSCTYPRVTWPGPWVYAWKWLPGVAIIDHKSSQQ